MRSSLAARLEAKIERDPNSGCWLWAGADNGGGYGKISVGHSGRLYAHRASYELARGPIAAGLHLDHLCRTPACVNPQHLEPVTNAENCRRGKASALRPEQQMCVRGHQLSVTRYIDSQGHRQCRECLRIRQTAYRERKIRNA